MPKTVLPDRAIVLAFIRQGQGWSQADLARAAGTAPNVINDYERGRKPLTRPRLEQLLACMAVPADRIEATLSCLAGNRAASWIPGGPGELLAETRPQIDRLALRYGRLMEEFARSTLHRLTLDGEALHGRQTAGLLWQSLKPRTAAERRVLVEDVRKYRHWALVERLAAESIERAANHPREALELAELALAVAERVPGCALAVAPRRLCLGSSREWPAGLQRAACHGVLPRPRAQALGGRRFRRPGAPEPRRGALDRSGLPA